MKKRRHFIKLVLGVFAGMGLWFNPLAAGIQVVFAEAKKMILPKGTPMDRLAHQNPADLDTRNLDLTPLEKFGTMGLDDHQVDLNRWQLEIDGHVARSLRLSYNQVLQLPSIERNVLLICPGFFAYHARWKGISVAKLLETAGIDSNVAQIAFSGPEGRGENSKRFPLADILSDKVFLAYSVNDSVLPKKHGFPLRVVAQDHYGGSWVKYVYKVTAIKA